MNLKTGYTPSTLLPWLGKTAKLINFFIADKFKYRQMSLTKEQWILLSKLREQDGYPQSDLAFITDRNKASLARLITTMEKKNLVARIPSKEDKRVNHIFITKKGHQTWEEGLPVMREVIAELQEGLTDEEIESAINTLKKVQQNIKNKCK